MSPWRALTSLLFTSGCVSPAAVSADSRLDPPLLRSIPSGQALGVSPPSPPRSSDSPLQLQLGLYVARESQAFSRVFRDTYATTPPGLPAVYAVPVQAGRCYRVLVTVHPSVGRTLRLYDQATLLDEDLAEPVPVLVVGRRHHVCADRDRVWRLELSGSATARDHAVAVLATAASALPYQISAPPPQPSGRL